MKSEEVLIHYKRHIFTATDPTYKGTFAVDFVVPPYDDTDSSLPPRTTYFTGDEFNALGSDDTKPLLITLHGLSGGSHEVYLRTVLEPLVKTGWEALVVNARGCAMSKITSSVLYNARATWDVRQVVKWCRVKWPKRQLFGIGFSLGGNILTNVWRPIEMISSKQRVRLILMPLVGIVPRGGRRQVSIEGRGSVLQSMESGRQLESLSTDLDR